MKQYIKSFDEMTKQDFQEAGGKAANLGELTKGGFRVPPGFCVTSEALFVHIDENGLEPKIDEIVERLNYEDYTDLEEKTKQIRELITSSPTPEILITQMKDAIKKLNDPDPPFVAVRSSVAVKGSTVSSFPGMMDTYHYIKGEDEIIHYVKECWASLWTSRAAMTRQHKGIDHKLGLIAPVVQKMVNSEVAGVMFTANPITSSRDEMVIESNWGLGESVVSGKSMNDFFLVGKQGPSLKQSQISKKTIMIDFDSEKGFGRRETAVPANLMDQPTLTEDQVLALANIGLKIEDLFGYPQDVEWAYENGALYVLQSRNIKQLKD